MRRPYSTGPAKKDGANAHDGFLSCRAEDGIRASVIRGGAVLSTLALFG